ncbi:mitogen-activated protein kinase MAPK [Acrasis kona]|uniref:Mitogen-activated protein kinase MAPK n=1 Tax=Acrasis kona TaxID=1008807 RepID=A0AAW2YKQ7_9EUKA
MSTTYVATRWYRAPELLLMWDRCTKPIDVWSVGCIMAEMLGERRRPIFPGKTYLNQLDLILAVTGTPHPQEIHGCNKALVYMKTLPYKAKADLSKKYPGSNPLALDLLSKLLTFDPLKRITVEQALAHPYLADFHDQEEEVTCDQKFLFSLDNSVDTKEIKRMMYNEILKFHELDYDRHVLKKIEKEDQSSDVDDPLEQILVDKLISNGDQDQEAYFHQLIISIAEKILTQLPQASQNFTSLTNALHLFKTNKSEDTQKDLESEMRDALRVHKIQVE